MTKVFLENLFSCHLCIEPVVRFVIVFVYSEIQFSLCMVLWFVLNLLILFYGGKCGAFAWVMVAKFYCRLNFYFYMSLAIQHCKGFIFGKLTPQVCSSSLNEQYTLERKVHPIVCE